MPPGSRDEVSSFSPGPFWAKPLTHVGLFHTTTVPKCVRVPTHTPLCWAGFPGGFRVTAFQARFTALMVSRGRGGLCITPASGGEDLHLYSLQVIDDRSGLDPSSLACGPCRGNGSQLRPVHGFPTLRG
jgi:hypothetical protein